MLEPHENFTEYRPDITPRDEMMIVINSKNTRLEDMTHSMLVNVKLQTVNCHIGSQIPCMKGGRAVCRLLVVSGMHRPMKDSQE